MRAIEGDGMQGPIGVGCRCARLKESEIDLGHDLPRIDPSNLDGFNSLQSKLREVGLTKKVKRPDAVGSA